MVKKDESLEIPLSYGRMETDTAKSYEAFVLYRDAGPSRSCAKVGELLGKTTTMIENWCSQHRWVDRAKLWDRKIDGYATRQELMDRQAAQIRHIRMLRKQQDFANVELEKHVKRSNSSPDDVPTVDADKAAKIAVEAIKGERLILGDPTERTENTGSLDWSNLDADEIIMFKALIIKLKGGKDDQ